MEEEKPAASQESSKPHQVIIKKNNFAPLVGALIFLGLVIGATIVYLGMQQGSITMTQNQTATPTLTPITPTVKQSPSPTVATPQLKTFTSEKMKDLAFTAFSISHPVEWITNEEKTDITRTLTISRNSNEIKIHQGPMGGNQCVFEGEMPDGPANDYRNTEFVEIKAGDITLRRIPGNITHSFCSNSPQSKETFGIPTIFGVITYTVNSVSSQTLKEMDAIISSLRQQ